MVTKKESEPKKLVRLVVYVDPQQHRHLKSVLAMEGISVSEWVRNVIKEKLADE